jgi:phosphatidylserine decarboxylase
MVAVGACVNESVFMFFQRVLPKRLLTELMGSLARAKGGAATHAAITWFIKRYQVNMAEAQQPNPSSYSSFNEFFTRPLKPGARPLANTALVCPVDGAISQFGPIANDHIFQAKGRGYSTTALLGGDAQIARAFKNGAFATLYLSPRDYHRIHMPCAGTLTQMLYVPGDLYSVNPTTANNVDALFARNERVVCMFDTANGPMAMVLVGATIVGSMATVWHGVVNPPRLNAIKRWSYTTGEVNLAQGAEMGRFLLGSTVVMVWPQGVVNFNPAWAAGAPICMGQVMGV